MTSAQIARDRAETGERAPRVVERKQRVVHRERFASLKMTKQRLAFPGTVRVQRGRGAECDGIALARGKIVLHLGLPGDLYGRQPHHAQAGRVNEQQIVFGVRDGNEIAGLLHQGRQTRCRFAGAAAGGGFRIKYYEPIGIEAEGTAFIPAVQ